MKASVIQFEHNNTPVSLCSFSSRCLVRGSSPTGSYSLTHSTLSLAHTHTHKDTHFPSLWCILVSGVLCFSSQGREESGLGSKLTINSTLPEPRTRSNTSTPSLFLLLLLLYFSSFLPSLLFFFLLSTSIPFILMIFLSGLSIFMSAAGVLSGIHVNILFFVRRRRRSLPAREVWNLSFVL